MLKTAQVSQSYQAKKFTVGILCLSLTGLTILNNISGLFPPLIPLVFAAVVIVLVQPYLKANKFSLKKTYLAIVGTLTAIFFNVLTHPASAQFMNKAQTFFNTQFNAANNANQTTVIALTFAVLRGIYIIYLAIALIGIFNSMRNDEDWMTAARTPMLVLLCVTLGDLMTGLITNT